MEFKVFLKNSNEVVEFVRAAEQCSADIDMKNGSTYLDGKSLLGVMTMAMKREMNVKCSHAEPKFLKTVQKFAVV